MTINTATIVENVKAQKTNEAIAAAGNQTFAVAHAMQAISIMLGRICRPALQFRNFKVMNLSSILDKFKGVKYT